MGYSNIKQTGLWKDIADSLNYNFNEIASDILNLEKKTDKSKGLFKSEELLNSSYPYPSAGYWALVGINSPFKIYIEENGKWKDSGGTVTLDVPITGYLTSEKLGDLTEILDNSPSSIMDLSIYPRNTVLEYTGENVPVDFSWEAKVNGGPANNLSSVSLEKDGFPIPLGREILGSIGEKVIEVNKRGLTKVSIRVSEDGKTFRSAKSNVFLVLPIYLGFSNTIDGKNLMTSELEKLSPRVSPVGIYKIENPGKQFLWICIPNDMRVNKVEINEELIGLNTPYILGDYLYYRSTNHITSGELTIKIS